MSHDYDPHNRQTPIDKLYHGVTISYDGKEGVLRTFGAGIEELVQVRARMQEDILRQAVIIELEKLGYTIISPEEPS
jgi:hypothetical protein